MSNRLLIFTDTYDERSDLLGVVPSWVDALAKHGPRPLVITQHAGTVADTIFEVSKKEFPGRMARVLKVARLLWKKRNDYDDVLVIMAPSWAIVCSLVGKVLGKKVFLWYSVWRGNWKLKVAEKMVSGILCSVPEAYPFKTNKLHPIGQGIDVDKLQPDDAIRRGHSVLFLGRISPVKKIEVALRAVAVLYKKYPDLIFDIVGAPSSSADEAYLARLKETVDGGGQYVLWHGRVSHTEIDRWYRAADISLNMTPAGSFDKTMLEAMACGSIVISSNPALKNFLSRDITGLTIYAQGDAVGLADAIDKVWQLSSHSQGQIRQAMRDMVVKEHSLEQWALRVLNVINP